MFASRRKERMSSVEVCILPELHFIERSDYTIVLHPPTYTLFKVSLLAGRILRKCCAGAPVEEIANACGVTEDTIQRLAEGVRDRLSQQQPVEFDFHAAEPTDVLPKLELLVSNTCNLNCVYCYAYGGDYGREASVMEPDIGIIAVDRMLERYKAIESVVFFGGEPLMNLPAIQSVCEHFEKKLRLGEIQKLPAFGVITNGTLITEKAAALISKYNIHVTVSIDGPKELNDQLRPFNNGCGSFDSIKRGVDKLRQHNVSPAYEATYTQYHVNHGYTPIKVLQSLQHDLGFDEGVGAIGDAEVGDGDPLKLGDTLHEFYEPLLEWSLQRLVEGQLNSGGDIGITVALQILFKQSRPHICPAGFDSLAIAANGDVFPCHILMDKDEFRMGNVKDENWFNSASAQTVVNMLRLARKEENPYCSKCWARYICAGCLGNWEADGSQRTFITEANCDLKRSIWDTCITKLIELKDDRNRWERFEHYLAQIVEDQRKKKARRDLVQIDGIAGVRPQNEYASVAAC
jgi:uncharacterized protein